MQRLWRLLQRLPDNRNHDGNPEMNVNRENDMEHICISSLVVRTKPGLLAGVRNSIESIPQAEVLGQSKDGKLVVMLDTANNREAADRITELQSQDDILSATLIYQFDNQFESQAEDSI
jgi:nitrate reductase NapD